MTILGRSMVTRKRHLAKSITWRAIGTLDTFLLGWIISGDIKVGVAIGGFEIITKMVLYYFHERLWYKFKWGVKDK